MAKWREMAERVFQLLSAAKIRRRNVPGRCHPSSARPDRGRGSSGPLSPAARAAASAARTKGQNVLDVLNVAADRKAVALPHLLCFTSFFFARLMRQGVSKQNLEQMGTGYDFAGVRRWTRKLEMFPLHRRLHLRRRRSEHRYKRRDRARRLLARRDAARDCRPLRGRR